MYGRFDIGSVCFTVGAEKRVICSPTFTGTSYKKLQKSQKFYRLSTFKIHRLSKILSTFRLTRECARKNARNPGLF